MTKDKLIKIALSFIFENSSTISPFDFLNWKDDLSEDDKSFRKALTFEKEYFEWEFLNERGLYIADFYLYALPMKMIIPVAFKNGIMEEIDYNYIILKG